MYAGMTEEEIEEEKRKQRIRKLLEMQRKGAGAQLAKIMEGRGVNKSSSEEEVAETPESSEFSISDETPAYSG